MLLFATKQQPLIVNISCVLHPSLLISRCLNLCTAAGRVAFIPSSKHVAKRPNHSGYTSSQLMAILESPSAERNKGPIYDLVLEPIVLPRLLFSNNSTSTDVGNGGSQKASLKVLELAAGCGVHTTHFITSISESYPDVKVEWHPSDPDLAAQKSIDARVAELGGLESCVQVKKANGWILGSRGGTACNDGVRDAGDAGKSTSGTTSSNDDSYNQHISYFDLILCINMIHIAPWEATLGLMECAGTMLRSGGILMCYGPYLVGGTAVESNLKFDLSLKSKDASWGLRNLESVIEVAKAQGLEFVQSVEMPANNLSVLFCKK